MLENMDPSLGHIQNGIALGNEKALAELYRLFSSKLKHFAKAITHSNELAEEIVEDVFVKLWCNRSTIMTIGNLNIYLYVSVKNQSLNCISQKAKSLITAPFDDLEIEIGQVADTPYDLMITAEMLQKMQQAIEQLPPRCKMVFKLVREDGLKYKEVAEILNIAVNTIDAQMAIAVKRICTALQLAKPSIGTPSLKESWTNKK